MRSALLAAAALLVLPLVLPAQTAFAADTLRWPNPWKEGQSLAYETESLDSETGSGKHEKTRTTSTTQVRISKATADGFVQEWVSRDMTYDVLEGDKASEQVAQAALKSFEGFPIAVDLDQDGNYTRIGNVDAVSARMRTVMKPVMVAGMETALAKLDKAEREKARPAALQQVEGVLDRMTSPAVVEAMLSRDIQTYNAFVGVDLEPGQWYELETELDNPLGGKKFPAKLQVAMYASDDDPDDIFLEWKSAIDPEKGMEATWELVEKLYGEKIGRKQRKGLPREIAINDEGFAMFRRNTGVTEMFEYTRTVKLGEYEKTERERMRLTNGDHDHEWNEEPAAADDDA